MMNDVPLEFEQRSIFEEQYKIIRRGKVRRVQRSNKQYEIRSVTLEWDGKYFYFSMNVFPHSTPGASDPYLVSEKMQLQFREVPSKYKTELETHARMYMRSGPFEDCYEEPPPF